MRTVDFTLRVHGKIMQPVFLLCRNRIVFHDMSFYFLDARLRIRSLLLTAMLYFVCGQLVFVVVHLTIRIFHLMKIFRLRVCVFDRCFCASRP